MGLARDSNWLDSCDFLQMAVRDALTSAMDEEMTRDDKVSFI